ncbi:MAG: S-methyl-5-thioribose-1-phosphate isomerase [Endomicrobiia bacterium]
MKTLFFKNNKLYILNQKLLPHKIQYFVCRSSKDVIYVIKNMIIRGAPAIGIACAFGISIASREKKLKSFDEQKRYIINVAKKLLKTRPTAVNLKWAVERMLSKLNYVEKSFVSVKHLQDQLLVEAKKILKEDIMTNRKIAKNGTKLLKRNSVVLTHCNAGAFACGGIGTALGVIVEAYKKKKIKMVYVDETRPYLQGARITTFELKLKGVPVTLITDNMAGYIMRTEKIDAIIVGADRIAKNGDTANKIGTYTLAVLAKVHKIPFYVVAPTSTIDGSIKTGDEIPIEERPKQEVVEIAGVKVAPNGIKVRHPAFDVTPSELITAIITEKGIFRYPYKF